MRPLPVGQYFHRSARRKRYQGSKGASRRSLFEVRQLSAEGLKEISIRTDRIGFYLCTPESLGVLELFLPLLSTLLRICPQGILTGCGAGSYDGKAEWEHSTRIRGVLATGSAFVPVPSNSFEKPYGPSLTAAFEAVENDEFHRHRLPEQADYMSLHDPASFDDLLCDLCSASRYPKRSPWRTCLFCTIQSNCRTGTR